MEDGLERNFTWLKNENEKTTLSKEKNPLDRAKKVFLDKNDNNIKNVIQQIRKNKIE